MHDGAMQDPAGGTAHDDDAQTAGAPVWGKHVCEARHHPQCSEAVHSPHELSAAQKSMPDWYVASKPM